jgi:hypothetical protein
MRFFTVLLVLVLAGFSSPVGAVSKKKQCVQRCGGLTAACARTANALGFGNLAGACKKSVLKRCKSGGVAVCDCGDGTATGNEACDGSDLKGTTCQSLHFASGTVVCRADCTLDTTGCVLPVAPSCGNGVLDGADQCDGTDLGSATCQSRGFAGGTLACGSDCHFDTTGCTGQTLTLPVSIAGGGPTWWDAIGSVNFTVDDAILGLPKVRYDAYDDFWAVTVDGNAYAPTGATMTPAESGTTIVGDVMALSGLNVTQRYTALADSPTIRVLLSLTNPTGAPISSTIVVGGNLGSDTDTTIEATSSGDTTFSEADRWLITSDGVTASDPVNTFVFFGPGAANTPTVATIVTDQITVTFAVTVPAGATQNLLFFGRLAETASDAEASVTAFDAVSTAEAAGFLAGLSATDRTATVNWSLPGS